MDMDINVIINYTYLKALGRPRADAHKKTEDSELILIKINK